MTLELFTTGQASGMTRLPLGTMRRYVSTFEEHFSKSAIIDTRGRRFTPKDIELLLVIRRLYAEGQTTPVVHKYLEGKWNPVGAPRQDIADAAKVVDLARKELAFTRKIVKDVHERFARIENVDTVLHGMVNDLEDRVTAIEKQMQFQDVTPSFWEILMDEIRSLFSKT